jgi:hypothetical protein
VTSVVDTTAVRILLGTMMYARRATAALAFSLKSPSLIKGQVRKGVEAPPKKARVTWKSGGNTKFESAVSDIVRVEIKGSVEPRLLKA